MNIKKLLIIISIFIATSVFAFADEIPFVTFSLGLTTGHTFYGYDSFEYTYKIKTEVPTEETTEKETTNESDNQNDSPTNISSTIADTDNSAPTDTDSVPEEELTIEVPMKFANGTEILIGTSANINFNVTKYFSLFTDLDVLSDLNWHNSDYSHHLDYSGSYGVRLYFIPNIPAISVSIAYLFGQRADFFRIDDVKAVSHTPFGNGIKMTAEYNFSRDGFSRFAPTVGCSWRHIPRGNNTSDNIISAYVQMNL